MGNLDDIIRQRITFMNENQSPTWEKLTAYFDGELDRAERLEMEQLLFENPDYAQALREWKELRAQFQALPARALLPTRQRQSDLNRNVMDRILESISAGEVEWDTRPVELDERYRLQHNEGNAEPKVETANWKKDYRQLRPEDRMRRWNFQLGALGTVAALLVLTLFVTNLPTQPPLTADRGADTGMADENSVELAESDMPAETMKKGGAMKGAPGAFDNAVAQDDQLTQHDQLTQRPSVDAPTVEGPTSSHPKAPQLPESGGMKIDANVASKGSSAGPVPPLQSKLPAGAGATTPVEPPAVAAEQFAPSHTGLVLFETREVKQSVEEINDILASNGFDTAFGIEPSKVDANQSVIGTPAIVLIGGVSEIANLIVEIQDAGYRMNMLSHIPAALKSSNQTETNYNPSISPSILGQGTGYAFRNSIVDQPIVTPDSVRQVLEASQEELAFDAEQADSGSDLNAGEGAHNRFQQSEIVPKGQQTAQVAPSPNQQEGPAVPEGPREPRVQVVLILQSEVKVLPPPDEK